MTKPEVLERWTLENAADLYGIQTWSHGYFEISEKGEVLARPTGRPDDITISLPEIIEGLKARGIDMPVLLRFGDIIASRLDQIYSSFNKAIEDYSYKGGYKGVYPIKVNQQHQVVDEIMEFGRKYHHGLEAGSKAELIAALACVDDPEAFIVCNGYKDEEFINLALYAMKLGLQVILVIERPAELALILERSAALQIRPRLGVRVRLSSRSGGHWDGSAGDRGIFGLNTSQIISLIDNLREKDMLDCLQMLHYHLGSQITNIRNIRNAAREAVRFYVEMTKEGAAMGFLDIGGGLAVDYDGSHTNFENSRNYSENEYASDIVESFMSAADEAGIPHPTIVTEAGRATIAHHSVLVFNVLDSGSFDPLRVVSGKEDLTPHEMIDNLIEVRENLSQKNFQECYHDAVYYRDEIRSLFQHGRLSLRDKAYSEDLFWEIVNGISEHIKDRKYVPDELHKLSPALADVYYCNFSVFQSLPDAWAIDQLFPVMPLHRLNERPQRKAILSDITCDSDGRIDKFIDLHDVKDTLCLHELDDRDYYLGVFLIGAYQETLGDLHNLLGDTNVLHVRLGENGFEYSNEIEGDTVADVLSYVEYDPAKMIRTVRSAAEKAVREGRITAEDRREIMLAYENMMRGYTYFRN
ncbi:MAG: biosynthetic arginine decarboxylase [Lentisphaerae bacterium]|nr:biosynthetic arginine decarboxylase [Lentisphaerota bacterium]